MFHKVIIIIYGILMTVNGSIGLFTYYYQQYRPTSNLRSPVNTNIIISNITSPDTSILIQNVTNPTLTNGTAISWITDNLENFTATITSALEWVKLFTGSFVGDFLGSIGIPSEITFLIYIPLGLYTAYLVVIMIINRGH